MERQNRRKELGRLATATSLVLPLVALISACDLDKESKVEPTTVRVPDASATVTPQRESLPTATSTSALTPSPTRSAETGPTVSTTPITSQRIIRALALDGFADGLRIEDAEGLRLTGPFTIEAKVKLNKGTVLRPSLGNAIISKKDAYGFFVSNLGCRPDFGISAQINNETICAGVKAPENQYVHLAVSYDGQKVMFYLDGKEISSRAKTGGININTQALFVGRTDTGLVTNAFRGEKGFVLMFNRARSAEQIAQDARSSAFDIGQLEREGMVLYLPFDIDFNDASSNKYKASILGEPKLVEVK